MGELQEILVEFKQWLGELVSLHCKCCGRIYIDYENSNSAICEVCPDCWDPCAGATACVRKER